MQAISLEYGWPDNLVSDNGPCYNACEFKQAMETWVYTTSQPHLTVNKQVKCQKNMYSLYKAW